MKKSGFLRRIATAGGFGNQLKVLVLMACVLCSVVVFGSTNKIDSLTLLIEELPPDSLKCEYLVSLSLAQYSGATAENNAQRALRLAKNLNSPLLIAKSFNALAWCLGYKEVNKKTAYLDSALHLFEQMENKSGQAAVYNTKASIMLEYKSFEEAKVSLEKALALSEELGNDKRQASILNNLGVTQNELGNPDLAITMYNRTLQILLNEKPQREVSLGRVYFGLGNSFKLLGQTDQAVHHFAQSYNYRNQIENVAIVEVLIELASLIHDTATTDSLVVSRQIKQMGFVNSSAMLDTAEAIALKKGRTSFIPGILKARRKKALAYGNFEKAYDLLLKEKQINEESKLSNASLKGFADLKIKYEQDQLRLRLLEEEVQSRKKEKQVSVLLFFLGIVVLVLIIGLLIFQNRLRFKHLQLTRAKQEQQKIAMLAMLEGQEKERARVSRDLHDGLGNMLSGLKISIGAMNECIESAVNSQTYVAVNLMIDDACTEVRKIAHEMMPQALERLGLKKALEDQMRNLDNRAGVNALFETYGEEQLLDDHQNMMLFRVIQEAINNIVNHAEASEVVLQLIYSHDLLNLTLEDDGKGFDPKAVSENHGMGLKSMAFRVNSIGGEYEIDSRIGRGTLLSINIPLMAKTMDSSNSKS